MDVGAQAASPVNVGRDQGGRRATYLTGLDVRQRIFDRYGCRCGRKARVNVLDGLVPVFGRIRYSSGCLGEGVGGGVDFKVSGARD